MNFTELCWNDHKGQLMLPNRNSLSEETRAGIDFEDKSQNEKICLHFPKANLEDNQQALEKYSKHPGEMPREQIKKPTCG